MMTREQLRKAWMNAQEINYNGNTLLVVQGFDIEGYALFGYDEDLPMQPRGGIATFPGAVRLKT